ncbi:NAD(P)H-binding protein [Aureimonas sp. AU22]|uniref:NAD(P)H-binding protein n=1 Tax=Aureimonas sp. AU22 TaxID=1638162 RepID=UPI000780FA60|nr:NAD(P)H-binding protein [Aureimonas sp. AU22]
MIVVTTPTGAIGSQVLKTLVTAGERVRLVARDPGRIPSGLQARVEVVAGSHGDADVVDRAFEGARAVFWLPPSNMQARHLDDVYVGFARPACEAIRRHGVANVVGISALGRGTPLADRAGLVTASLAMDDLIASTGVAYRALVMPSFMDNMLRQASAIRERGEFHWPGPGDLKAPTCATRDIADMAVRLLRDPTWTGQGEQAVLGPEDLSPVDLARIMSDVLGKPIAFRELAIDDLRASLAQRGVSPAVEEGYADMMSAKAEGLDTFVVRTPDNTTPTTFRQWCTDVLKPVVDR